ncbi:MAG: phosphoadenosine phosphosulfate reductase family protein, partial [Nanoarchaeota archaeon]
WNPKEYTKILINEIKEKVKDKKVFMLVSGGVDSTVAFTLLNKALKSENVYGLFIDNGLVREKEKEFVDKAIKDLGYNNFHCYDAIDTFLDNLKEKYEPEEKRKIIGDTFIEIQKKAVKELELNADEWLLGQGTIYPDTIESKGTKNSALIKTHHNRVEIIQEMIKQGKVIEPLADLYKDEVREVGLELGLAEELVFRHPFPGPGLGVRCLCSKGNDNTPELNIENSKTLPIKSVGVQGDSRTYRHPLAITKKYSWDELENMSTNITNKYSEINRVLYLISGENIQNIKEIPNYITKPRLNLLRKADKIAMDTINKYNQHKKIWQMPIVLAPIGINNESIILRPVFSTEAMTAEFAKIDIEIVKEIAKKIREIGIDFVFYDITNKPPGTIEWE